MWHIYLLHKPLTSLFILYTLCMYSTFCFVHYYQALSQYLSTMCNFTIVKIGCIIAFIQGHTESTAADSSEEYQSYTSNTHTFSHSTEMKYDN